MAKSTGFGVTLDFYLGSSMLPCAFRKTPELFKT